MWKQHLAMVVVISAAIGGLLHLTRVDRISDQPNGDALEPASRASIKAVAGDIDTAFAEVWRRQSLQSADPADELLVIRRLSLGLTGTLPSLEEIRAVQKVPRDERIDWWLARLFSDRRYSDFVAERFARAFVGTDNGTFLLFRRRRFIHWLSDQIYENRPYDDIVRDMLTATGTWTSNPAVNFITAHYDQEQKRPDPIRLAARTSRAFLGLRIDCLQCHDDLLGAVELGDEPRSGMQEDFHRLAAFYAGVRVGAVGIADKREPYRVELLGDTGEKQLRPRVPFKAQLLPRDGTDRERLARWVTASENRMFARVSVNRVWALMFGKPLSDSIDSIGLHVEHPTGMEPLVDDFIANGYDLQRLIRVIAETKVFRQESRARFEVLPRHEAAWAVFPMTRLRPEQVAGALTQACSVSTINADSHVLSQFMKFIQTNEFVKRYGDLGEDEFSERGISIPQRLLLMNGNLVKDRTKSNLLMNASSQISAFAANDRAALEAAFLACYTRLPSSSEASYFKQRLADGKGPRMQRLEDLYWVLINGTEFSWNH